jgi:hypothetical protein
MSSNNQNIENELRALYGAKKYHYKIQQKLKTIMRGGGSCPNGYEQYLQQFQCPNEFEQSLKNYEIEHRKNNGKQQ